MAWNRFPDLAILPLFLFKLHNNYLWFLLPFSQLHICFCHCFLSAARFPILLQPVLLLQCQPDLSAGDSGQFFSPPASALGFFQRRRVCGQSIPLVASQHFGALLQVFRVANPQRVWDKMFFYPKVLPSTGVRTEWGRVIQPSS